MSPGLLLLSRNVRALNTGLIKFNKSMFSNHNKINYCGLDSKNINQRLSGGQEVDWM